MDLATKAYVVGGFLVGMVILAGLIVLIGKSVQGGAKDESKFDVGRGRRRKAKAPRAKKTKSKAPRAKKEKKTAPAKSAPAGPGGVQMVGPSAVAAGAMSADPAVSEARPEVTPEAATDGDQAWEDALSGAFGPAAAAGPQVPSTVSPFAGQARPVPPTSGSQEPAPLPQDTPPPVPPPPADGAASPFVRTDTTESDW